MSDRIVLSEGQLQLVTDEGTEMTMPEEKLIEMLRNEIEPPIDGAALPDGVKFWHWRPPFLCIVHQLPAHVRQLRWIADDSPKPFGPGAKFHPRRLSMPYAISFVVYCRHGAHLTLVGYNELYFRNEPVKTRDDPLGYPALLNVSQIEAPGRSRAWICTQYLHVDPGLPWDAQLAALLNHTWNGAFNLSSEHHEGASWYGVSKGVHSDLHPIDRWERATANSETFALHVPWKPAPLNVGQTMCAMVEECQQSLGRGIPTRRRSKAKLGNLVSRFVNFLQQRKPKPDS